jgi:hypothetical protein
MYHGSVRFRLFDVSFDEAFAYKAVRSRTEITLVTRNQAFDREAVRSVCERLDYGSH